MLALQLLGVACLSVLLAQLFPGTLAFAFLRIGRHNLLLCLLHLLCSFVSDGGETLPERVCVCPCRQVAHLAESAFNGCILPWHRVAGV